MSSRANSQSESTVVARCVATGETLKHFRLESLVGAGGMGMVYRAQDTQLCRPVAVKILPGELTSDPERKQRFLQEARAAARINHPAIAQIFYADEHDGVTFIVMELVEGKTLRELIEARQLDLLGAIDLMIQVADGIAKAHELGIVHRDLKPANIMATSDGRAKILDFGLAKLLDHPQGSILSGESQQDPGQTTLPGVVMGTAAYMSPEQVRGLAVDGRADIFALGIILFELATGQSPFQRESFMDSMHAVAFSEPPAMVSLQAHLPYELQRIVARCLRKDPAERYADANLLRRDLQALRRDTESGIATKTSWHVRLTDAWDRIKHLTPSQIGWFCILAAGGGAAVYYSFSRIGTAGIVFLTLFGLYIARSIRQRPQKMEEQLGRRLAKIPEVLLICCRSTNFTIAVERPAAQLYTRVNQHLNACNKKLYFSPPMTVAILHDQSPDRIQSLLNAPGVQYVRDDVLTQMRVKQIDKAGS